MSESDWHEEVREKVWNSLKPNAYSSHTEISKLELYRGEIKRKNCLSDVDIIVLDPVNKNIVQLIEIEKVMNPKKLIGIVLATHFCDICRSPEGDKPLKDISLKIVGNKEKVKSKKPLKLDVIKQALDEILLNIPGSVASFHFEEHP